MTYTYDANGNILTRKTRANDTIRFGYDTLNRAVTRTAAASPQPCDASPSATPTVTYRYDLAGRLTEVCDNSASIVAAASGGSTVAYTTSYTYDPLNRPTGVTWDPAPTAVAPAPGPLVTFEHAFNAANQRISQSVSDNTWLGYPPATPATTTYTANSLNQYTSVGSVTPTYDGNGNLTSDGTYTLGYDPDSRLTSGSGAGNTATYGYDAQGRRKARTVNGTTTISVTDADNREMLEYDGSTGAILRWYAYGLGANDVLSQMNVAAGTRATLLPDMLGSVVASVDSASGTLTKSTYQPYGKSAAAASPFGYTGQHFDAETGLYYARARHYSPVLGRFLQPDPIGYAGGSNLYGYVGNDPLNLVDPSGLAAQLAAQAALQAAQAAAMQAVAQANAARAAAGAQIPSSGGSGGGAPVTPAAPSSGPSPTAPDGGAGPAQPAPTAPGQPAPAPRPPVEGLSFVSFGSVFGTAGDNSSALVLAGFPPGSGPVFSNVFGEKFVPDSQLPSGARFILQGREQQPNGSVFLPIPAGHVATMARNNEGIVFRAPGTTGNDNIIRIANPNEYTPYIYLRVYNALGQPISIFTGRPGSNAATHYPFGGIMFK